MPLPRSLSPFGEELVALEFRNEKYHEIALKLILAESPDSYVTSPGRNSVVIRKREFPHISKMLKSKAVDFTDREVKSIGSLSPEKAERLRGEARKHLLSEEVQSEEWLDAQIQELEQELENH